MSVPLRRTIGKRRRSPYSRRRRVRARGPALRGRYASAGGELKFFDTALSFLVDGTGEVPATGQLVLIPQGVTESQRVGRKCTIRSIQLKMSLLFNPAAGGGFCQTFIYLVLDKQANGAAAAATAVLTSTGFNTALPNLNNSGRFKILKVWVHNHVSQAGVDGAYNDVLKHIAYYKSCNIPIEYDSTAGAITEIRSNNVFLLAGAFGTDDTVTVDGVCRVRYLDR